MKCAPWACTKYGNRLEQPMPEMVVIFSCHSLRFSISLKYSASTEKSPQPGHHVGWSATISLRVRPLRSPVAGSGALMVTTGFSIKVWLIKFRWLKLFTRFIFHQFENFLHLPSQAVGLVDALNFRVAIAGAQNCSKLAVAVKPLVIHFHDKNMVEAGENVFQAVRQRVDVAQMNRGNAVAGGAGTIHGFQIGRA